MPQSTAAATLTATYNDIEAVKALFSANKGQIAGVILEPVVGNAGFIPPTKEFLLVRAKGSSVIFLHKIYQKTMDCYIERDGPAICSLNHHLVYWMDSQSLT